MKADLQELLDELPVENTEPEASARLSLSAKLGALLFSASRPLSVSELAALARTKESLVERTLAEFEELFDESVHGFSLCEVDGSFELRTSPDLRAVVQRLIPPRAKKLSRAAAETLAVIAYRQPVQRAEIEAIRGVDALPTLKTLLDLRLIRIVGREDSPGQPALYGTTSQFLQKFGLRDLSELPTERDLQDLADEAPDDDPSDDESEEEID